MGSTLFGDGIAGGGPPRFVGVSGVVCRAGVLRPDEGFLATEGGGSPISLEIV
jgi:hypothetical protein